MIDGQLFADDGYFGELLEEKEDDDSYWENTHFHGFVFRRAGIVSFLHHTESNHHLTLQLREGTWASAPGRVEIRFVCAWTFSDVDWDGATRRLENIDEVVVLALEDGGEGAEFSYSGARFGLLHRNPALDMVRRDLDWQIADIKQRARSRG